MYCFSFDRIKKIQLIWSEEVEEGGNREKEKEEENHHIRMRTKEEEKNRKFNATSDDGIGKSSAMLWVQARSIGNETKTVSFYSQIIKTVSIQRILHTKNTNILISVIFRRFTFEFSSADLYEWKSQIEQYIFGPCYTSLSLGQFISFVYWLPNLYSKRTKVIHGYNCAQLIHINYFLRDSPFRLGIVFITFLFNFNAKHQNL